MTINEFAKELSEELAKADEALTKINCCSHRVADENFHEARLRIHTCMGLLKPHWIALLESERTK
jgi:hypothetical protein